MTDHVLTIQRVLSDGAIAKSITCRSGRIAVLRGNAPEKLYEYELALRGQHEDPSAFRISFDGAQYKPSDHLFLGFEPLRFKSDATVTNVLIDCGLNPEEVKTILLSHGFSQLAGTPVSQLSPNEAHCLALLRASHQPYPLIIMNDPFIPIPEANREMFAQTMADGVWRNKTVGIVVSLSWRPDNWIDNDLITRVQVDQMARRATVGIGAENPLTELAKQLRKEKAQIIEKEEKKAEEIRRRSSAIEMIKEKIPLPETEKFFKRQGFRYSVLGVLLFATLWFVAGDLLSQFKFSDDSENFVSRNTTNASSQQVANTTSGSALLDMYPSDIREGVLAAFYGEANFGTDSSPMSSNDDSSSPAPAQSTGTSNSSFPFPPSPKAPSQNTAPSNPFARAASNSGSDSSSPPGLPEAFRERMERMMEGKDPAVRERIEMMMQRMREQSSGGFPGN